MRIQKIKKNPRISSENNENHETRGINFENQENHENSRIS